MLELRHGCRAVTAAAVATLLAGSSAVALAGPPYVSDDPEPTDYHHYEIYLFANGERTVDGSSGESGIDFNYGALPDLQLTAVFPLAYSVPDDAGTEIGPGNIELAAKYRFLHQAQIGWDVAVFPRLFLASLSSRVGDNHPALLLPIWLEKDRGDWSTFGGGGCQLNRSGDAKNFCLAGWALTRQVLPALQLGGELVHQTPSLKDGRSSTGVGAGFKYDISDDDHLLGYFGPSLQNTHQTSQFSWYASMLFTF
jgi:hypothetical protein